jgi:hypothetical protein
VVSDGGDEEEATAVLIVESGIAQHGKFVRPVPHFDHEVASSEIQAYPYIAATVLERVCDQLGGKELS